MADHTTRNGHTYTESSEVVAWTPTRQEQFATIGGNLRFLKDLTVHGVTAQSFESNFSAPAEDGFIVFQVANAPDASENEVTLINPRDFRGTNMTTKHIARVDCRYRFIEIYGTVFWSTTPERTQPRHNNDDLHKYVTSRWYDGANQFTSGDDVAMELHAWFYSGEGAPEWDESEYRVRIDNIIVSGQGTNITFFVDKTNGKLKMYWTGWAAKRPSYSFFITLGPTWRDPTGSGA